MNKLQEKFAVLKAILITASATFFIYFKAMAIPLIVLIFLMICDYISGMSYAYISHTLSSKTGIKGIIKKLCYFMAVGASMGADWLISSVNISFESNYTIAMLVVIWLVVNEIISILENLKKIGIPLPDFLYKIVDRLKVSSENQHIKK